MYNPKISVIIPVYNAENSIDACLKSIFKQTLKDIEIICINDGSTDNSLDLLKRYREQDKRIKLFSKENSGSGPSRNLGMDYATGEYIAFLDADDFIVDETAYQQLYSEAKKRDVVMASGNIQFIDGDKVNLEYSCFKQNTKLQLKSSEEYCLPWYFYKNIFKRSFLVENNIKFPDFIRGQDPIFFSEVLTRINQYLEVPVLYYSYKTPDEIKINNSLKFLDYFRHYYETFKLLTSHKKFKKMVGRYAKTLIEMKDRPIYINNKQELEDLVNIMDNIKSVLVCYDNEITKDVSDSFDSLLKRIELPNIEIIIKGYEFLEDIYSEGVLIIDNNIKPKISVVIPVYNVSDYLSDCLDSVINQTLEDIEIICIDDGSTDESLDMLNKYAKIDSRIKIFSFTNKGLGPARNRGIDRSNGEYIAFLDSDDWLELDFCEKIFETANKHHADLVMFNAIEEYGDYQRKRIYFSEDDIKNPNDFVFDFKWNSDFVLNGYLIVCSKLHRTRFLKENNIRFKKTLFEDMEFHAQTVLTAERICYNPKIFYHYRKINSESITNSLKDDECYCIFDIINNIEEHLINLNVYNRFKYSFIKLKIVQFNEKFDLTNDVFKGEFYRRIRNEFYSMGLNDEDFKKIPDRLVNFYKDVLKYESYWEYSISKNDFLMSSEEPKIDLNSSLNFLLIDSDKKMNMLSDMDKIISNQIQNELLDNNFINLKAYETIIDETLFNYSLFEKKRDNNTLDSLLYYIYLGNYSINNPTSFFDSEFYCSEYPFVEKSKINPLVFYSLYGQFEGKNNLNDKINIRSVNRRSLKRKFKEVDKLKPTKRKPKLIVSLTSFPDRMEDISYTLYSLFNQTIKPDKIILCLAKEEFPHRYKDIPLDVLKFQDFGLIIKWCNNIKSYKKLIPILEDYPDDVIVTADDDVYYNENWLKILWESHLKHPNDIIAHRIRKIRFDENNNIKPYSYWDISYEKEDASYLNLFTGVGGILYPPNSLYSDVTNTKLFEEICPNADDIWFWGMAVKNNTKIRVPINCIPYLVHINGMKELNVGNQFSLWDLNQQGGNDSQFKKLIKVYPEIFDKITK